MAPTRFSSGLSLWSFSFRPPMGYSACLYRRVSYPTGMPACPTFPSKRRKESEKPTGSSRDKIDGKERGPLHFVAGTTSRNCGHVAHPSSFSVKPGTRTHIARTEFRIVLPPPSSRPPDTQNSVSTFSSSCNCSAAPAADMRFFWGRVAPKAPIHKLVGGRGRRQRETGNRRLLGRGLLRAKEGAGGRNRRNRRVLLLKRRYTH